MPLAHYNPFQIAITVQTAAVAAARQGTWGTADPILLFWGLEIIYDDDDHHRRYPAATTPPVRGHNRSAWRSMSLDVRGNVTINQSASVDDLLVTTGPSPPPNLKGQSTQAERKLIISVHAG